MKTNENRSCMVDDGVNLIVNAGIVLCRGEDQMILRKGDKIELSHYILNGKYAFSGLYNKDKSASIKMPLETFERLLRLGALKVAS